MFLDLNRMAEGEFDDRVERVFGRVCVELLFKVDCDENGHQPKRVNDIETMDAPSGQTPMYSVEGLTRLSASMSRRREQDSDFKEKEIVEMDSEKRKAACAAKYNSEPSRLSGSIR